ncbi:MAG: hypothetical protein ACLTZB_02560 [Streptococcus salivarius]
MALLSLQQIHKTFEKGTVNENHVLRGLDLDIEQEILSLSLGEMVLVNQP